MIDPYLILDRIAAMFLAPIANPMLLWVIVPVYINWVINDLYTDKVKDFVNFVSGGFTALWIGLSLGRELTEKAAAAPVTALMSFQGGIVAVLVIYGLVTIIAASKEKAVVKYISRTREITYVLLWLVPVFYGIIPANMTTLISAAIFFPVFFGIAEVLDRYVIKSRIG